MVGVVIFYEILNFLTSPSEIFAILFLFSSTCSGVNFISSAVCFGTMLFDSVSNMAVVQARLLSRTK